MIRSLWSAASGMKAQQQQVDNISNNLANVNTVGYKKSTASFTDLFYANLNRQDTVQLGHGVKMSSSLRDFSQGPLRQTDLGTDLALEGNGFFRVALPDGQTAYTRDGSFKIDNSGRLVTTQGYYVLDHSGRQITVDDTLTVSEDGTIQIFRDGQAQTQGILSLATFTNPEGLEAIGSNLYVSSGAEGTTSLGTPGQVGFASIRQGFLEDSNVSLVEELTELMAAQRAYELASKSLQSADEMMAITNNLRR